MRQIAILVLALMASGCGPNIEFIKPIDPGVKWNRTYPMSFDNVWAKTVDWFANHNITIEKIEKTSGLITAKYELRVIEEYMDCGTIKMKGFIQNKEETNSGALNVTVHRTSPDETEVTVNFFPEFKIVGYDSWSGRWVNHRGRCFSTGVLEKKILDSISR